MIIQLLTPMFLRQKQNIDCLIKEMVDYARVGLHPSYFTMKNAALLKKEKERLEESLQICL